MTRVDVAIVGGGLAGCAAAIRLAKSGCTVFVIERERGAASKLCGEFLSARGIRALEGLGAADRVRAAGALPIAQWSVASSRREFRGTLSSPGWAIARRVLDPILRDAARDAGAEVREGARVAAVSEATDAGSCLQITGGDGASAGTTLHARRVVAAFGRAGRVPGLATEGAEQGFVAMKAHVRDLAPEAISRVALYGLRGGYVGVVPAEPGELNVCFLARRAEFRRAGSAPAYLEEEARASGPWAARWQGMDPGGARWIAVSSMSFRRARPRSTSTMFAGDAAAMVAPLLGDGMAMALESGVLAGEATLRILGGSPAERAGTELERAWSRRFRGRLLLGRALQSLLLRPRASEVAVRLLRGAPELGSWISGTSP